MPHNTSLREKKKILRETSASSEKEDYFRGLDPNLNAAELCRKLGFTFYDVESLNPYMKENERYSRLSHLDSKHRDLETNNNDNNLPKDSSVQVLLSKTVDASKSDMLSAHELKNLLYEEYASKYLQKMGVSETPQNVALLLKKFPIDSCYVERRRGYQGTYLNFCLTNGNPNTSSVFRSTPPANLDLFNEKLLERVSNSITPSSISAATFESNPVKKSDYLFNNTLPKFEEYSKRYIFPYNLKHKYRSIDNEQDLLATAIKDRNDSTTECIYEIMMNDREYEKWEQENTTLLSSITSLQQSGKKSYLTPLLQKNSVASNLGSIHTPGSNSVSTPATKWDSIKTDKAFTGSDSIMFSDSSNLKHRFSGVFNHDSKLIAARNDTTTNIAIKYKLIDIELSKPPFLANSEILNLQTKFITEFPFHLWDKSVVDDKHRREIRKIICNPRLTHFIRLFSAFCYWTFLNEFASPTEEENHLKEIENFDNSFLRVYSEIVNIGKTNRKSKRTVTINLPIILLCIRVVTETIFKVCYQNWWDTPYSSILTHRVDRLVSFLFDPDDYLSHLAPVESNVKERQIASKINRLHRVKGLEQTAKQRTSSKVYSMSPVVRYILQDATSFGARSLIKHQSINQSRSVTPDLCHDIIGSRSPSPSELSISSIEGFHSRDEAVSKALRPSMRAKIMEIYAQRFTGGDKI